MRRVPSKKPPIHDHFFKIITPHSIHNNTSIPKSFFKYLKAKKHQTALLRRGRRKWPVEIDGDGVFRRGWSKFVTENGVQPFDFILFKHEGNMVFDFMIFDQTTCEREYPNSQDNTPTKSKVARHFHEKPKENRKGSSVGSDDRCFTYTFTPYGIKSSTLNVPLEFARSNGLITDINRRRDIILMDEKQKSWPAVLRMKKTSLLLSGLVHLKVANGLKSGDVCMFELIDLGERPVMKFKNLGKKTENKTENKTIKNYVKVKRATKSTLVDQNYFISTLKPCNFRDSVLYLPVTFSKANCLQSGKMIIIDEKNRSWEVDLKERGRSYHYITRDIRAFLIAIELKEGDAFKFEIIENKKNHPPIVKFSCLENKPNEYHKRAKIRSTSFKRKPVEPRVMSKHETLPSAPTDFTLKEEEDIYSDS